MSTCTNVREGRLLSSRYCHLVLNNANISEFEPVVDVNTDNSLQLSFLTARLHHLWPYFPLAKVLLWLFPAVPSELWRLFGSHKKAKNGAKFLPQELFNWKDKDLVSTSCYYFFFFYFSEFSSGNLTRRRDMSPAFCALFPRELCVYVMKSYIQHSLMKFLRLWFKMSCRVWWSV